MNNKLCFAATFLSLEKNKKFFFKEIISKIYFYNNKCIETIFRYNILIHLTFILCNILKFLNKSTHTYK